MALIERYGSSWFRSVGSAAEPGTTLLTVSGAVAHPGVMEVATGLSLAAAIESRAASPRTSPDT